VSIGPVEYIVVGFPGNQFKGEIAPALKELVDTETVRIVDLVFITKDEAGEATIVELDEADAETFGADFASYSHVTNGLMNDEDIDGVADALPNNTSAALMIWENTWATKFAEAVRNADGMLIAGGRIPHAAVEAALAAADA
jgi:uncharacterized membrane protein